MQWTLKEEQKIQWKIPNWRNLHETTSYWKKKFHFRQNKLGITLSYSHKNCYYIYLQKISPGFHDFTTIWHKSFHEKKNWCNTKMSISMQGMALEICSIILKPTFLNWITLLLTVSKIWKNEQNFLCKKEKKEKEIITSYSWIFAFFNTFFQFC